MNEQFFNPHQHSDGSLDGAATVKQIVQRSKELGAKYVTITEHGNMNTAMTLYTECKEAGIKPILGIEVYLKPPFEEYMRTVAEHLYADVEDPSKREKKIQKKMKESYVHLTVHFKDQWAYNYFTKLSETMESRALVRWGDRKPICTIEELKAAKGHITIGSGCIMGLACYWMLPKKNAGLVSLEMVERGYLLAREIAGEGNFYAEVFPHKLDREWIPPVIVYKDDKGKKLSFPRIKKEGYEEKTPPTVFLPDGDIQKRCNQEIIKLAQKYNDPILISLDSHFAYSEQKVIQDAKLGGGTGRWRSTNSYHIMSTDECAPLLKETLGVDDQTIQQWVDNSHKIASLFDNFKIHTFEDGWVLNKAPENFMTLLKQHIDKFGRMDWSNEEMVARLKKEIKVLFYNKKLNLYDYFAKVEHMADYCHNNHILMTVRGSGAGCFLLYLLGVSPVNSIKHGLSFERFLTEGRIDADDLPDVDIDLSHQDKFFNFLEKTYGKAFCRISTDTMLKLKSSIKDTERHTFGKVRAATERLTKKIPSTPQGMTDRNFVFGYERNGEQIQGIYDSNEELQKYARENPEIWNTVCEMMGVQRQKSTHACGFVIADRPIEEYCPITYINESRVTGFSPKSVTASGLIKFDGLGVNTLRDIQECLDSIRERTGEIIDPWTLPYCPKSFREFARGNTETVFQFNTTTVIPFLKSIKPNSIDELAAVTALCRPGTLDAIYKDGKRTLAQVFVDRCKGESIEYIHDDLAPILSETMGIQLYQEQTISIFKVLVGYNDEQAETVRKGIGKKKEDVLKSCMTDLYNACIARGWAEGQISMLQQQIMASSNYAFNKSHAVSYAYIAYACMWLKINYRLDWWKAALSNATKDEISTEFWKYVHEFVQAPSILHTGSTYEIQGDRIVAPLNLIKGLGVKGFNQICNFEPYDSIETFVERHLSKWEDKRSAVTFGTVRKLTVAGAFDAFFPNVNLIEEKLQIINDIYLKVRGVKADPVPEYLIGTNAFDQYMFKKQVLSIHSIDLRELMFPHIKGSTKTTRPSGASVWVIPYGHKKIPIFDWRDLQALQNAVPNGGFSGDYYFLAYIVDERTFRYKDNSKQATEITMDINGFFHKEAIWPPNGKEVAPSGFKNCPVIVHYNAHEKRLRLQSVEPVYDREKLEIYSLI